MRFLLTSLLVGLIYSVAYGQHNPYEFYLNNDPSFEGLPTIPVVSDAELFYLPLSGSEDIFTRMSDFNFSAVKYARRGYNSSLNTIYLDNIELSTSAGYSILSGLRSVRLARNRTLAGELSGNNVGSAGAMDEYFTDLSALSAGYNATVFGSNRRGRGGGRFSATGKFSPKWIYTAQVGGRWGRDASIDGVFTDEASFLLGAQRQIGKYGRLSLIVLGSSSENGLRSSATKEAFELTDNNYYNPSWGYWDGKERSSKVVRRFQPFSILTYHGRVSDKTTINASASYRFGKSSYSALAWHNAATPYPDYYRYMPSHATNVVDQEAAREHWASGGAQASQLNWDRMWEANLYREDGAAYLLEDRVEDVNDLQVALSAQSKLDGRTSVSYGLRGRVDGSLFYKEMKDLLGGRQIEDRDQYIVDDEIFGGMVENDMRNPGRRIGVGDRFGYNYNIYSTSGEGYAILTHKGRRFRVSAQAEFGVTTLQRRGNYEKALYPGDASYGRSKKLSFENYTIKASVGYSFSPRHIVSLWASTASMTPEYGNIFISPLYTNKVIDGVKNVGLNSAEFSYLMTLPSLRLRLSGFYTHTRDQSAVYGYYDDINSRFSDMVLTGIDKQYYGVELGAEYVFSPRLSLTLSASLGSYTYASDPDVTILEDATMQPFVVGAKSYLDGYRLGTSPQRAISGELKYSTMGWLASVTYSYMGKRHISPNPLRRMREAYQYAGDGTERFLEFVTQEKLAAASTVSLFLLKSFNLGKTRLTALGSVNNLLGDKDIVYSGYEQMRLARRGEVRIPFESKYLYSYGRSYYVSLIYRF